MTLSRQRDGSCISGSFLKTLRQTLRPRGLTPASYSREHSLLSAARLTTGLFPYCMMGLFSAACSMMMLFPCCMLHEGATPLCTMGVFPCSRQTMEAWKRSSWLSPGGLLSKDEPHFKSQPKKKQRCLEGEAVWIECGSILLLSVFYCSAKSRPPTAISLW